MSLSKNQASNTILFYPVYGLLFKFTETERLTWTYSDLPSLQVCGFILTIVFLILSVIYYRRVRKIRETEVAWEGDKTRA